MLEVKFENTEDLFNFYSQLSKEQLEQEKEELTVALTKMISNPDIMPRLAMVTSLLENGQN